MNRKLEQRANVKFYVQLAMSTTTTLSKLRQAYGDKPIDRKQCVKWYKLFKNGRTSLEEDGQSGRRWVIWKTISDLEDDQRFGSRLVIWKTINDLEDDERSGRRWVLWKAMSDLEDDEPSGRRSAIWKTMSDLNDEPSGRRWAIMKTMSNLRDLPRTPPRKYGEHSSVCAWR